MHRIDTKGAAAGGQFQDGNPFAEIASTVVDAAWLNAVQENVARFIESRGLTLTKGDHDQLTEAIEAAINAVAGGLSTEDRTIIDSVAPIAGPGPSVRELVNVTDWQSDATDDGGIELSGWSPASFEFYPCAEARIPRRYLANGGVIKIRATGTLPLGAQRSGNPTLGFKAYLGGVLLRPEDSLGVQGWTLSNGTTGTGILTRTVADARWFLEVDLYSLGEFAAVHAGKSDPGSDGQVISRGHIEVLDVIGGNGLLAQNAGIRWATSTAYSTGDVRRHAGESWRCFADHTSAAATEPGVGADWFHYWTPAILRYEICGSHTVDVGQSAELPLVLEVGAPFVVDVESDSAWAVGHGTYNVNDRVENGASGERWICTRQHSSASANEPGVGADYETYWVQVGDDSTPAVDRVHVDAIQILLAGGAHGFEVPTH